MSRVRIAMWITSGVAILTVVILGSYEMGISSTKKITRQQLANLVLGPLEPQLESMSDAAIRENSTATIAINRSVTMSLGTIAVELPDVATLNGGALAALCLAVKQKEQLLRPQDSASVLVYRYLREVEVALRLEAVQRRRAAPATRCALLEQG